MSLPTMPSTHTWVTLGPGLAKGGRVALYVADDAEVWAWDEDTNTRITDLLDVNGDPVTLVPVQDGWIGSGNPPGIGVPVAVQYASFSVGQYGKRMATLPVQTFKNAASALAPTDTQVATLTADTGSSTRAALNTAMGDEAADDTSDLGAYLSGQFAGKADLSLSGHLTVREGDLGLSTADARWGIDVTGSSATGNAAAFAALLTAALNQRRKVQLAGWIKMDGSLDLPDGLVMEGHGLTPDFGTPSRLDFSALTTQHGLTIADGSSIRLSDFYVTGRTSGSGSEIMATGNSRLLTLERLIVNSSSTGSGISLAAAGGSVIASELNNVEVFGSATGFDIGAASTSIALSACYANACANIGYTIRGTYINLTACAADNTGLYGYNIQGTGVGLDTCGGELNGRAAFHMSGAKGVTLNSCRGVSNNTSANAAVSSFADINDGSDFITFISCTDTTPNAASVNSVKSWNGTPPTVVNFIGCDFPKGVSAIPQRSWTVPTTTTAPTAGGAGALPATPAGYASITVNGVARKVAYY